MFTDLQKPILQRKRLYLDKSQLKSLKCLQINCQRNWKIPLCGIYTCIDQAMAIWGFISAIIFVTAQFLPLSWYDQAVIWSIITFSGIISTVILTHSWTKMEKLSWLLYVWVGLMIIGTVVTDLGIIHGWSFILGNLCELWLLISAIGYCITALRLYSKAFFLSAIIHCLTIVFLPLFTGWQFLLTGLVMATNLLIFTEWQWDMFLVKNWHNIYCQNVFLKKTIDNLSC